MRRLDAGTTGAVAASEQRQLDSLALDVDWQMALSALCPSGRLRPIQARAVEDLSILGSRRNLVVSAPTNSGKSLIGHLLLLDAVRRNRRAVLLEPLRALAREKAEEVQQVLRELPSWFGAKAPLVRLSTGDYRLEGESFSDPPPVQGEVIVATPERLDAILRTPAYRPWFDSVGALVVDEAHLIGSSHRGPTLEYVIAAFKTLNSPPRIALLSATMGRPERLAVWLAPCDLLTVTDRTPPLSKEVLEVEEGEDADEVLTRELSRTLSDPAATALVFVYQRRSADTLARRLNGKLDVAAGDDGAVPYHSGMSLQARANVQRSFLSGRCKCLVTTTALALGVNLPATHVYVRDTTFHGSGRLSINELVHMLGRAGRGETPGVGSVLVRPGDGWCAAELAQALREERLSPVRSSFEIAVPGEERWDLRSVRDPGEPAATIVAAILAKAGEEGATVNEIRRLLANTLGGEAVASRTLEALRWLEDSSRRLAYSDEDRRYRLTMLGERGCRAVLPLSFIAGIGQFLRDLLEIDPADRALADFAPLDHLILGGLLSDRPPGLARFSEKLAEQVDGWVEARAAEEKPVPYREWIAGSEIGSKSDQLLGSLQVGCGRSRGKARELAYVAVFHAILLDERSRGAPTEVIESRWGVRKFEGVEEMWRDAALWLLGGQARLYELRRFYHHLLESCGAGPDRIKRVKRLLVRMRHQTYDLQERLKYCSSLGPLMRGVRGMLKDADGPVLGVGTIRRLETAGLTTLKDVAGLDLEALVALGIRRAFANQIQRYIRRRLR